MWRFALAVCLSLGTLAGCLAPAPVAPPSATTPAEVVGAAKLTIENWRVAQEARDLDALSRLYERDIDLVVVQDGLASLGWSSVQAMLADRIARHSAIRIRMKDIAVIALGLDAASVVATMTRESTATSGVTSVTESGTLTLVLRRQPTGWIIASEHYSYRRPA